MLVSLEGTAHPQGSLGAQPGGRIMTPSNRRMMVLGVAALALGGVVFAAVSWDRGPRHGGRYDEIARLITKNLDRTLCPVPAKNP